MGVIEVFYCIIAGLVIFITGIIFGLWISYCVDANEGKEAKTRLP